MKTQTAIPVLMIEEIEGKYNSTLDKTTLHVKQFQREIKPAQLAKIETSHRLLSVKIQTWQSETTRTRREFYALNTLENWTSELNKITEQELCLNLDDLPDAPTAEMHAEGLTPEEAYQEFICRQWADYDPEAYDDYADMMDDAPECYSDADSGL